MPIDGIVGVLEQIGACLINEMIRVFVFHYEEANTIDRSRNRQTQSLMSENC